MFAREIIEMNYAKHWLFKIYSCRYIVTEGRVHGSKAYLKFFHVSVSLKCKFFPSFLYIIKFS